MATLQDRVMMYLSQKMYQGENIVNIADIRNDLGLNQRQMMYIKSVLLENHKVLDVGDGKISIVKPLPKRKINGRRCKYLSECNNDYHKGRPFCLVRGVVLGDLDWSCGVYQLSVLEPEPHIEYENICKYRCD